MEQSLLNLPGLRVLVVEDNPICQKVLHKKFIKWKYRVTMCRLAQEALNVIQQGIEEFDIVVTEIKLPDMDGAMFVPLLRRLDKAIPIIMLCGAEDLDGNIQKMLGLGATDFVLKPIKLYELRLRISCRHYHSRKRNALQINNQTVSGSTSTAAAAAAAAALLPIKETGKEVDQESE